MKLRKGVRYAQPRKSVHCGVRFALLSGIRSFVRHFRDVPGSDICSATNKALFDHLVGDGNQFIWNLEAESLGGLEVDGQFELRWLLNGKISRLGSLQDAIDIRS